MAVVLSSEENGYFSSSLRRSHSQPKFVTQQSSFSRSPSRSKSKSNFNTVVSPTSSASSSAPSSPQTLTADSVAPSYPSTPASSLSLDNNCDDQEVEDQILFPSYDDVGYYDHQVEAEDLEPPASPHTGDSYTVSPTSNSTSTNVSRPESPEQFEHAEDDTAVRIQPTRHVDYLSHNWKEEDIWSSWKHIVSKRKAYGNSARLENASWRTWTKSKNKLKTVSPETLNWLKDCDVTWLYGPLQTGSDKALHLPSSSPMNSSRISKNNSFLHKKPILKKRSVSEIMLQRSLSSSSLLKQAAAAVQAQQYGNSGAIRPAMGRRTSEYAYPFSSRRLSRENTSMLSSISSSGVPSPGSGEKKHIHFNEQVEQCIALDMKGDDDEESGSYAVHDYDSDSDDGAIMMKRSNSRHRLPPLHHKRTTPRQSFTTDSKTIAMLPSTTLKYRADTPEPPETAMKHSSGIWNGTKLSPSPSQETLRPSKPSTRMLLGDDEEDDDMDWQPANSFANRKDSVSVTQERFHGLQTSGSSSSLNGEPSGMRRTPSGMFMPYEEDEDDVVSEGLFGKVVDTVNTAKDIAHVIWNVGWRR
ncbi:related to negative regulator of glucose-repressible genes [Rhynchosporium agropyri]|uniref:Related to negative regulator of glucose-repressible genes n=1 Tax=Rhynchosporium agropyri TaxID=914238 RepID=A0A1E1LNN5_9HELO|nr:related to negative regulator of glucose-repressible genes [Rhynchosporium agropyri]